MDYIAFFPRGDRAILDLIDRALNELVLFTSMFLLAGGINDGAIDLIWICRSGWRRLFVFSRHPRGSVATLAPPRRAGRIAILVAAWREDAVIGAMLRTALGRIAHADYRIYVGVYDNDPATIAAVAAVATDDARVRWVGGACGPTTKGECLNRVWRTLVADEAASGERYKAVVMHDAEDVIHSAELRIFDTLIERFDLVQLPVLPIPDPHSHWIAGHYCDEFAEAHHRQLVVREAIGAGVPSAGVGCAISRRAMETIAGHRSGHPFDETSLTEDYEIGLRLTALGYDGVFVAMPAHPGGRIVAVRAHFPSDVDRAIRQKARWMVGIALAGWDRLGWHPRWAESWMRLRDRVAPFAALVLFAAYLSLVLWAVSAIGHRLAGTSARPLSPRLALLLDVNAGFLLWRIAMRFHSVRHYYGTGEACLAVVRIVMSNAIAMCAARRALVDYWRHMRGRPLQWDKTPHHFPYALPAE